MTTQSAATTYDIHPLLRERRSPRAFAPTSVAPEQIQHLLEAARWSPSGGNEQPWNFIVVSRDDEQGFAQALEVINDRNRVWAQHASLLVFAVARLVREANGQPNAWATYDLGQAVAHMTIQAAADGLWVHQMGGFSADRAREVFGIPENHAAITAIAIGELGDIEALPDDLREREAAPRQRKPLSAIAFGSHWGEPFELPQTED